MMGIFTDCEGKCRRLTSKKTYGRELRRKLLQHEQCPEEGTMRLPNHK